MENHSFKQKLIYNDSADTTSIQNILLICSKVVESQLFLDSVNSNTFSIIYSQNSDKNELIELLRNKFKNGIKRASFAFHDPLNQNSYFLDNKLFFDENDLIDNQTTFSENVTFLTNLINEFNIENCDFLACNSLQYNNWKKYYELLNKITNVICGASNNNTGNLQYGSDWIMENTNENVRDIYFTNSINNYTSSLEQFTINNVTYTYTTSGNNATVTGFSSPPSNWNLTIPSTVTNNSITYNVTSIGDFAFFYCTSLISITIPELVTSFGIYVFYLCTSLTSINVDASNLNYSSENGILFNKNKTILLIYPVAKNNSSYTIPNSVTDISNNAFNSCTLLSSITIPNSVTSIGNYAFNSCTSLLNVYFEGNIPTIGSNNFTASGDTAYYITGATTPNNTTPVAYLTMFTNKTISTPPPLISNICFVGSTPITTNQGNIPIDKINSQIHTIRNKKIIRITQTTTQDKYLVCFEKDSLAPNIPSQKTIISSFHCIYYQGKMMQARDFVGKYENVNNIRYRGETLYNVLMEDHEKMLVNNLICETLNPKNAIVEVYKFIDKLNPKEQESFIKANNKYVIDNKVFNK